MVMAAVRYCLGRATYIVADCIEWIKLHWCIFEPSTRETIIKEIREAIEEDNVGMKQDRHEWQAFLDWVGSDG